MGYIYSPLRGLIQDMAEVGADRPRLGRTWGESTRGGSTLGRIDRYPTILRQ